MPLPLESPLQAPLQSTSECTSESGGLSRRSFLAAAGLSAALVTTGRWSSPSAAAPRPMPVLYVSGTDLARLPRSGRGWAYLQRVGSTDPGPLDLSDMGSFRAPQLMGAALLARMGAGGIGRARVVARLQAAIGTEDDTKSPKDFYRHVAAVLQTAALVDHDLSTWARAILSRRYGTGKHPQWDQIQECARTSGHNFGSYARSSLAAIGAYLRDPALLREAATYTRQWTGEVPAAFRPTSGSKRSLAVRAYPGGQGTVNPRTADWRNGINVEDGGRGLDRTGRPSGAGVTYQEGSLEAQLSTAIILAQNGYPDALRWGEMALLRNSRSAGMDWRRAAADRQHIPYLLNYFYPGGGAHPLPVRPETKPGHSLGFGEWLASGSYLSAARVG